MLTRQSPCPASLKNATAWMSFTLSGKLMMPSVSSYAAAGGAASARVVIVSSRDPAGRVELHAVQHRAEDPHAAERAAVVVRPRDPLRVGAGLDAPPRDLEAARRDVREVKRSGVGQQRQVDVRRDVSRERRRPAPRSA